MTEERRTHVTLECGARRLGMYLEPADDAGRGAIIRRFDRVPRAKAADAAPAAVGDNEDVDYVAGEIEASGVIGIGFQVTGINDQDVTYLDFGELASLLTASPRPVRITFRDPGVVEFRDRYGFIRTKMHVERESAYFAAHMESDDRNNRDWCSFLQELGAAKGSGFGVSRLLRDACGELVFPVEPAVRLNAMSPLHGRMEGISSSSSTAAAAAGKPTQRSHSAPAAGEGGTPLRSRAVEADAAPSTSHAAVVVSIFKRCWRPGTIGVPQPPGLSALLPGEVPPKKVAEKHLATLVRLVSHGGIPAAFRCSVWYEVSGAHAKAALHLPGYYASLVAATPAPEAASAIVKDLDRTFPGHPFFETREGIASLQRLLNAFSVHNSDVGYCQSINFLAGFLLLLLPEEHAFWVLDVLVNELLPPNYYNSTLMGVHIDQRVLAHLVDELMPDVSETLQRAGVQLHLVVVEWFMCCFCTVMPAHAALRVWDAIFIHGAEVLFRVGLVLIHMWRSKILSVSQSSTTTTVTVKQGSASDAAPATVSVSSASGGSEDVPILSRIVGGDKDTVAETATKVLAAASTTLASPKRTTSVSSTPATPGGANDSGPVSPVVRGGTVRTHASTFPALFAMMKTMPTQAHDIDELMRLAYPASSKDARATLPWDTHLNTARIARLRSAARAVVQAEYDEVATMRAAYVSATSAASAASAATTPIPSAQATVDAGAIDALKESLPAATADGPTVDADASTSLDDAEPHI